MRIRTLCFGAVGSIVGRHTFEIELADGRDTRDLVEHLLSAYPAISRHRLFLAVNQVHTPDTIVLNDGDEVAVFTAVSGG